MQFVGLLMTNKAAKKSVILEKMQNVYAIHVETLRFPMGASQQNTERR